MSFPFLLLVLEEITTRSEDPEVVVHGHVDQVLHAHVILHRVVHLAQVEARLELPDAHEVAAGSVEVGRGEEPVVGA